MAPSSVSTTTYLRSLIYYHLDHSLLKNALFFAQRLVAYEPRSGDAAYLLALCQYQSGLTKAAWDTSRPYASKGSNLGCCYVFAQASLELGKYVDGLHAIEKSRLLWQNRNTWNLHSESRRGHIPDAAAVLCLKGKLWKEYKNMDEAVQCWAQAVKLNPFMWDAVLALTESGAKVNISSIYQLNQDLVGTVQASYMGKENLPEEEKTAPRIPKLQTVHDPFTSAARQNGNHGSSVLYEKLNNSKIGINKTDPMHEEQLPTPSMVMDVDDAALQNGNGSVRTDAPPELVRKPRSTTELQESNARSRLAATRAKTRLKPAEEHPLEPPASKRTISAHVLNTAPLNGEPARRSTRLQTARPPSQVATAAPSKISTFANSLGLRETRDIKKPKAPALVKGRTANAATVGRVVSGNRIKADSAEPDIKQPLQPVQQAAAPLPPPPMPLKQRVDVQQLDRDIEAIHQLLDLNGQIAMAQYALSIYDTTMCISILQNLPSAQRETPFVLSTLGRAHYECAQYSQAEKYFIRVRQLAPAQLTDMEIYSTTLWHLKSDVELAYLAHELAEIERNSPQTWVAIGNSFSLQREHEQALKCFKRSTQLDPAFAYGFTLQGHEYVANEEFEKALEAYRSAVAAEPRHYNAWYGLGKVYEKLGKYTVAETHYRTAVSINPSNAVLMCCIGMVLEKTKQNTEALRFYDRACRLAPKSALSRFKKARCLMTTGDPEGALQELEMLKDIAPDEANVWFLMGRLYKMVHRRGEAIRAFTIALNLDPKVSRSMFQNLLKEDS